MAQWTAAESKIEVLGVYECVCCGTALFSSKKKYDSGSGWPSFVDSVRNEEGNDKITRKTDFKFGMRRTEVGISPSCALTFIHIRCFVPLVVLTLHMFSLMGRVQLDSGSSLSFFLQKLNLAPPLSGIASTVPPLILWRMMNRRDGEKHSFDRFIKKIYYL